MNQTRLYLIIGAIGLALLLLFILLAGGGKRYQWKITYEEAKKDPYGAYLFYNLLKNYYPDEELKVIRESVTEELPAEGSGNYIFVGAGMYMDSSDTQTLLQFVENGNDAFIATTSIPQDLMFYIMDSECEDIWWEGFENVRDTAVSLSYSHPELAIPYDLDLKKYKAYQKVSSRYWRYISDRYFCEDESAPAILGYADDYYINFCRFSYGNGAFYLHTMPLAFTNINLLEEEGLAYAAKAMSHLAEGPIYWDKYSRKPGYIADILNTPDRRMPNRGLSDESPMEYVLSQPSLAWAWYLTLALGLLFLLFRAKRTQKAIPVLEQNKNTSLEFIQTIGRLFFLQRNHRHLALQKMQYFLAMIRDRYKLMTNELNQDFVTKLAFRSKVGHDTISSILEQYKMINGAVGIEEHHLETFNKTIEQFWTEGKQQDIEKVGG